MGIFGNMMNNYYYGKAGKGDYRVADMPQNRRQLFGAVLKVRWGSMVGVNLLSIVAWIPAFVWTLLSVSVIYQLDPLSESYAAEALGYLSTWALGLIPCITITGPFTAGASFVMRNWARDEHSFVWSDFWEAFAHNWKPSLVISFISSLVPLVLLFSWQFYSGMANTRSPLFMLPLGLVFAIAAVWKMAEMIMYVMLVTYDLKLGAVIRNSVLMAVAKLPLSILIKLMTLVVPIIVFLIVWFIPSAAIYALLIGVALYALFMPAFNRLITASFANALCEKYINTKIEGARTNIGLRPENWDDTEYIPQDDEE